MFNISHHKSVGVYVVKKRKAHSSLKLAENISDAKEIMYERLLLSTKWVDYVEEPMKYQALRPQFFFVGG